MKLTPFIKIYLLGNAMVFVCLGLLFGATGMAFALGLSGAFTMATAPFLADEFKK